MQTTLSQFQRHQLEVIARVTPHSMAAHLLNTTVMAIAVAGSVPVAQLICWCVYSYTIALLILYRHVRSGGRVPRNFPRAARRATLYAILLSLPWSVMAVAYLGSLPHDKELILVALVVGMVASGTILLSALPFAAFAYMSVVLVPGAIKCLVFLNQTGYVLLGVLAVSYWWFLAALIAKITREIAERKQADIALKDSEVRLQEALTAGQVLAFTWDPGACLSQRSANASQILCMEPEAATRGQRQDFLACVHPEDRGCFLAKIKGLSPDNPAYSVSFRFIGTDGREVWLEETGKAEFDAHGRYLRLKGLTRDITERKRAEERQRMLVCELDHRVKNVLASVSTVAQRTRESSGSMDEFLRVFDGRIKSMANAHALLSRSHWRGVSLAELVRSELEPCMSEGSGCVDGPDLLLAADATQPIAIVLHELVTNASKYGALSTPHGRIAVRWEWCEPQQRLVLKWIEADGPPVVAPNQPGYGTDAIRNLVPYELGGTVELSFSADGLRCTIELPSECLDRTFRPSSVINVSETDSPRVPASSGVSSA